MLRHLPVVNFMKIVSFFKMPTDNDSTCKRFNECVLSYGTGRQAGRKMGDCKVVEAVVCFERLEGSVTHIMSSRALCAP